MFLLIERGEVYAPEPRGQASVLCAFGRIARVAAKIRAADVAALEVPVRTLDASGCYVVPGLVDSHNNLIGAGGEQGPATRCAALEIDELVRWGTTTAVGIIGGDSTTRTLTALLGKVKELNARGMTAYMYTGAMQVPPPTISGRVVDDVVLIQEVLGVGEIAIACARSTVTGVAELAQLAGEVEFGGNVGGKAGVMRVHVGPGAQRLKMLHELLDQYEVRPERLYVTHVTRTKELMDDAIALAKRGAYVDTDTVEEGTAKWLPYYLERGGEPGRFTFSSDAQTPGGSPERFYREMVACVRKHGLPLERVLPHFTAYAADALKLEGKGRVRPGAEADLLLIDKGTMEIRDVVVRGRVLVERGRYVGQRRD